MADNNSKLDTFSTFIPVITSIIAVIGLVIPIAGFSFEQGYLSVFGISSETMSREISESWGRSFYIALVGIVNLWSWLISLGKIILIEIILLGFICVSIVTFITHEKLRHKLTMFQGLENKNNFLGHSISFIKHMYIEMKWGLNIFIYSFLILAISAVFLTKPFTYGQEIAQKDIEEFKLKSCEKDNWSRCTQIQDLETNIILKEGFLVAATNRHIALYDGNNTTVISRLPSYAIVRDKTLE